MLDTRERLGACRDANRDRPCLGELALHAEEPQAVLDHRLGDEPRFLPLGDRRERLVERSERPLPAQRTLFRFHRLRAIAVAWTAALLVVDVLSIFRLRGTLLLWLEHS